MFFTGWRCGWDLYFGDEAPDESLHSFLTLID
jgi:hypothetical protein